MWLVYTVTLAVTPDEYCFEYFLLIVSISVFHDRSPDGCTPRIFIVETFSWVYHARTAQVIRDSRKCHHCCFRSVYVHLLVITLSGDILERSLQTVWTSCLVMCL